MHNNDRFNIQRTDTDVSSMLIRIKLSIFFQAALHVLPFYHDSCVTDVQFQYLSTPRWPSGKASASRAEDPGFESRFRPDFFGVESYQ